MNIFEMSLSAGLLIFFIMILRFFTRHKLRENTFVLLWKIVLIRLFIPISIPITFSGINLSDLFKNGDASMSVSSNPETVSVFDKLNATISEGINIVTKENILVTKDQFDINSIYRIWLVGVLLFIVLFLLAYRKECKKMREALPIEDCDDIKYWLLQTGTKRKIIILQSDRIATPITYGFIRPRIVLPKSLDLTQRVQLECALTHEMMHINSFDNLWKILAIIAICFHWFNPLVWMMYFLFNQDLELSCDEKVISLLGESEKKTYAMALINMAEHKNGFFLLYNGFGKNSIQERVLAIMKYKKKTMWGMLLSLLLIVIAVQVFVAVNTDGKMANESSDSYGVTKRENLLLNQETIDAIQEYTAFGLEYNLDDDEIYYENKVVRELLDEKKGTYIARTLGASFYDGSIDVYCVYENDKLTGLRIGTEEEYNNRTAERIERSKTKTTEAMELENQG